MVSIGIAYGDYIVTSAYIQFGAEGFLNPKLFECHFASAFNLAFPFAKLFIFHFHSTLGAAMFKLNL